MACGLVIRVCLLAASVVTGNGLQQEEDSVWVRRHKIKSPHMLLEVGPSGDLHKTQEEDSDSDSRNSRQPVQTWLKMQKAGQVHDEKQPGEVSYCDQSYPMGTENSNTCVTGNQIIREEDCKHAAGVLGLTVADSNEWLINDDWVNPNTHPKNCFLFNDKVHFNPTASNRTDGWEGQPICQRIIYQNGTKGVDSDAGCTGDYEPISSYKECEWAHDCQWGAMYCQENTFANDHYTTQDAPRGCYRSALGCYGFNKATAAVTGTLTEKTPVCRLKTYKFDETVIETSEEGETEATTAAPTTAAPTTTETS